MHALSSPMQHEYAAFAATFVRSCNVALLCYCGLATRYHSVSSMFVTHSITCTVYKLFVWQVL